MRFLLCDSKASLTDGVYRYKLDARLHNASRLQLKKCSFQVTHSSTPPLVIYLRSKAIQKISKEKHTVELKVNNYQDGTDILCILEESHTVGRYILKSVPRPIKLGYSHLRDIDIYFTNPAGTNVLIGAVVGGGANDLFTASDIAARSDLWTFFNFSDSSTLTNPAANTISAFEAVNDSNQAYVFTNASTLSFVAFGANSGKAISFSGDWLRATDSTGVDEEESGMISILFKSQSSQDVYAIFKFGKFRAFCNNGVISFDPSITNADTTMIVENSEDYLLTIIRDYTKGDDDYGGMNWRLEKLSDNTVQTYKGIHGGYDTGGQYDIGGVAAYSAAGTQISNMVGTSAISEADVSKTELYLRHYHTAQTSTRTSWRYTAMLDNMSSPSNQQKYFNICSAFDSGGGGNQYGANEALNRNYYTLTGEPMSCKFLSFQTETNYDFLTIVSINADGSYDTANPLVNLFTGGPSLPNSGAAITGSVGSIGIRFIWTSDSSNNQNGWEAILWDSSLTLVSDTYVDVAIAVADQLDPTNGNGGNNGDDPTGEFVVEMDIDTK